jgi:signal transduction histidine kinase
MTPRALAAQPPSPPLGLRFPIHAKILLVGGLVTTTFALVTLHSVRLRTVEALHDALERRAVYTARSLAASLEEPVTTGDQLGTHVLITRELQSSTDLSYIIVRDRAGRVVDDTFPGGIPPGLARFTPPVSSEEAPPRLLRTADGLICEAAAPIIGGRAGDVRVGLLDSSVRESVARFLRSVYWALALCALAGIGLGTLLTFSIARPVNGLAAAADRVRHGDFECRASVLSNDELGDLAVAFNSMAEALQEYRRQVEENEATRAALLERTVLAQEDERRRISRELHDELGQCLSTLLVTVQAQNNAAALPAGTAEALEAQIREIIAQVRAIAWAMRPSILDDYGLDRALARYVQEVSRRAGARIDYESIVSPTAGRLPDPAEVCLYRIVQEALSNVLRHAHATRASVVLVHRVEEITLLVEDDGTGFDPADLALGRTAGLGLLGMRERAALIGGEFTLQSTPTCGTSIRVRLPLNGGLECRSGS